MARGDDAVEVEIDGHAVRISSPGKVLFEERGDTKLDLVEYYAHIAAPIMRTMGGRPVLMQRFPNGAGGSSFFQKRVPDNAPEWLETTIVSTPNGTTSRALVAARRAYLENRYADFARLARSHWARLPAVVAAPGGEQAARADRPGMIRTGGTTALPADLRLR